MAGARPRLRLPRVVVGDGSVGDEVAAQEACPLRYKIISRSMGCWPVPTVCDTVGSPSSFRYSRFPRILSVSGWSGPRTRSESVSGLRRRWRPPACSCQWARSWRLVRADGSSRPSRWDAESLGCRVGEALEAVTCAGSLATRAQAAPGTEDRPVETRLPVDVRVVRQEGLGVGSQRRRTATATAATVTAPRVWTG